MGQQSTLPRNPNQSARSYPTIRNQLFYNKRIQNEGLIKLRPVPFKNCVEIQTDNGSFFLENIEITLKDLLESRLYTNKLFPKEDIERLIENVTYTLAFLSQNGIPYKDVSTENIFYEQGAFKLLPNQLIAESRYQKFITSHRHRKPTQHSQSYQQFIPLSPQMIIAYRCKQPQITDIDIIDKSNVFYLGLLLLQTATLLPAHECYDVESCDILDEVISQRVELVRDYYSEEIAAIVANMLDYDYAERLTLKEASIFVNRELNRELTLNSKISRDFSNKKSKSHIVSHQNTSHEEPICSDPMTDETEIITHQSQAKSTIICKSRIQPQNIDESRLSKQLGNTTEKKRNNKTNKIYMNGGVQEQQQQSVSFLKEQRNKVYMRQVAQQQESKRQNLTESQSHVQGQQRSTTPLRQIHQNSNNIILNNGSSLRPPTGKLISMTSQQRLTPSIPAYTHKPNIYQANNEQDQENQYPQEDYSHQLSMKRKTSTDYLGLRATQKANQGPKTPKRQIYQQPQTRLQFQDYEEKAQQNNYVYHQNSREDSDYNYPTKSAFGQRFNERDSSLNEDSGSRGYFDKSLINNSKSSNNVDFKDQDHSLNRIKSEIERSRKLIEEFKRGETLQY